VEVNFKGLLKKREVKTDTPPPAESESDPSSIDASNDQKNAFASQVDFRHMLKKKTGAAATALERNVSSDPEQHDFRNNLKKATTNNS